MLCSTLGSGNPPKQGRAVNAGSRAKPAACEPGPTAGSDPATSGCWDQIGSGKEASVAEAEVTEWPCRAQKEPLASADSSGNGKRAAPCSQIRALEPVQAAREHLCCVERRTWNRGTREPQLPSREPGESRNCPKPGAPRSSQLPFRHIRD